MRAHGQRRGGIRDHDGRGFDSFRIDGDQGDIVGDARPEVAEVDDVKFVIGADILGRALAGAGGLRVGAHADRGNQGWVTLTLPNERGVTEVSTASSTTTRSQSSLIGVTTGVPVMGAKEAVSKALDRSGV